MGSWAGQEFRKSLLAKGSLTGVKLKWKRGVCASIYCYSIPSLPPRKSFKGKILLSKPSTHSRLPVIPDLQKLPLIPVCIPIYLGLHTGSQKRAIRSHPYHSFPKLGTEIMPCSLEKSYRGPRGQSFQKYGSLIEMLSDWCDEALGLERRQTFILETNTVCGSTCTCVQ